MDQEVSERGQGGLQMIRATGDDSRKQAAMLCFFQIKIGISVV